MYFGPIFFIIIYTVDFDVIFITTHYGFSPNFQPFSMDFGLIFYPNSIHYRFLTNFSPNTIYYGCWKIFTIHFVLIFHPDTIDYGFLSSFPPNTIYYGFWTNFHYNTLK